jgi:formylglycine-generating enzyme required for sulfatase activity
MKFRALMLIIAVLLVGCKPDSSSIDSAENVVEEIQATDTSIPTIEFTATPIPTQVPTYTPEPSPTPTIEVSVIDSRVSEIDNMLMVFVPEGPFDMGSDEGWDSERPIHNVNLPAYWMDQTEVTNAQYELCVSASACDAPGNEKSFSRSEYYNNIEFDDYPVINVSWYDANAYCEWAGKRLPSEAEWEKAARNGENLTYPWGEDISCERANYIDCIGDTTAVGTLPSGASPYGVLDLSGNVWEWVADWYNALYYEDSPLDYPKGPDSGAYRVVRGGSWNDYEWYLRSASRYSYFPDNKRVSVGFRCVLDATE